MTTTREGGKVMETTTTEKEALAVADELRAILAKHDGRVVVHPGKLLDLAKRLEAAAL